MSVMRVGAGGSESNMDRSSGQCIESRCGGIARSRITSRGSGCSDHRHDHQAIVHAPFSSGWKGPLPRESMPKVEDALWSDPPTLSRSRGVRLPVQPHVRQPLTASPKPNGPSLLAVRPMVNVEDEPSGAMRRGAKPNPARCRAPSKALQPGRLRHRPAAAAFGRSPGPTAVTQRTPNRPHPTAP